MTAEGVYGVVEMLVEFMEVSRMEPAKGANGLDQGDETTSKGQSRFERVGLHYEEVDQHNKNANGDIPGAHRMSFEGSRIGAQVAKLETRKGV